METTEKIRLLMSQALADQEGNGSLRDLAAGLRARQPLDPINIRSLSDRGYGRSRIFRILLTNACVFNCSYCPMRADRSLPRHALPPAALAEIFMSAYKKGWVQRLALLCDRVSYNLEAACQATLDRVAPEKRVWEGFSLLKKVREVAAAAGPRRLPGDPRPPGPAVLAGATTQFVVGIGKETDRDFLETTHRLWKEKTIHHPHFAAFRPIEDTPLENEAESPLLRENRLYQADYLLRQYGFQPEELQFSASGNLPLARDPKLTWALAHPERFPVEMTTADRETLLRVPGLGPRSVERLLRLRRGSANVDLPALKNIGAVVKRAAGFLSHRGKRLGQLAFQESLFTPEEIPAPSRVDNSLTI